MHLNIQDILAACPQTSKENNHLYIYQNGREYKLFNKGQQERNFKIIHAFTILKALRDQPKEISELNPDEVALLTLYVQRIKSKKKHSAFINFLSKLQNILTFKGFNSSFDLANKILDKIPSQDPSRQGAFPRSVEIPLESMPKSEEIQPIRQKPNSNLFSLDTPKNNYLRKTQKKYIEDFITQYFLEKNPKTKTKTVKPNPQDAKIDKRPLISRLTDELKDRGYPFVKENWENIHELALDLYADACIKNFTEKKQNINHDSFAPVEEIFQKITEEFPEIDTASNDVKQKLKNKILDGIELQTKSWERHVKNVVTAFLEPFIQGKITPQNESPYRETLETNLMAYLREHFSHLVTNNEIIDKQVLDYAAEIYFFEAVHGMDLYLNNATFRHTASDVLASRKNAKHFAPINDAQEVISTMHKALIPALKRDLPSLSFDDDTIVKNIHKAIHQYRLWQVKAFQETFESLTQMELVEMIKLKKLRSVVVLDDLRFEIMANEKEFDFFVGKDPELYSIIKHQNQYYKALLPQSTKQIAFVAEPGLIPATHDSFKFFGIKVFSKENDYFWLNKEGTLIPLSQEKYNKLINLAYNPELQLLGAILYNLPVKNTTLITNLVTILNT